MSYRVQLPDTIEAENSVHALDPNAPVRRHQEAKTLIPRLVQHTHIRPILEEQPSNYTNASQRGIDPASVYHLVDIEFKDAYLNRLTIPSQCAPLLRVSPILNMPGVSSLQSVDFKGHTQGMAQTVSMIGNILGVNTASSTELKNWLRGDGTIRNSLAYECGNDHAIIRTVFNMKSIPTWRREPYESLYTTVRL